MTKLENNYRGKITVVNKYKHSSTPNDVYIGRGSIFGNPYSHLSSTYDVVETTSREEAISKYETWFKNIMESKGCRHRNFKNEIRKLIVDNKTKDLNLVCFCKPKACHGDVIKKYILNTINNV